MKLEPERDDMRRNVKFAGKLVRKFDEVQNVNRALTHSELCLIYRIRQVLERRYNTIV